jgi:hypothetical protein
MHKSSVDERAAGCFPLYSYELERDGEAVPRFLEAGEIEYKDHHHDGVACGHDQGSPALTQRRA